MTRINSAARVSAAMSAGVPPPSSAGLVVGQPAAKRLDQRGEARIALVPTGGVGLAVWVGGVTLGLALSRRASGGSHALKSQPSAAVRADRWRALCRRGDERRRVVGDVIAGTSAGGLIGSLL